MKRVGLVLGLALIVGAAGWFAMPRYDDPSPQNWIASASPTVTMVDDAEDEPPDHGVAIARSGSEEKKRARRRASPDAKRNKAARDSILRRVEEHRRAQEARSDTPSPDDADEEPDVDEDLDAEPEPGNIKDRIGGRKALMDALNRDFMPLADECIAEATARLPELEGMLAIGIEVVGDAELGSVVETVSAGELNEVDDADLWECMEQTALSTMLPPPPEGVEQEALVLTRPIERQPAAE